MEREAWCTFSISLFLSLFNSAALTSLLPPPSLPFLTKSTDYGLETLPILLCVYLFLLSHPGRYIPSDRSIRLHPEQQMMSTSSASDLEKDGAAGRGRGRKWWGGKRA